MRPRNSLRSLFVGLWLGAIVCAGVITAPAVFTTISSRTVAGTVFGEVLHRLNWFELICIAGLIGVRIGTAIFSRNASRPDQDGLNRQKRFLPSDLVLLLMIGIWVCYARILTPEMARLKAEIQSFDVKIEELERDPLRSKELEARKRFDSLHAMYSRVMQGNLALGVLMVFIP